MDAVIARRLRSDVPLVAEVSQYIIAAGGKRLRPALLLLMSGVLGFHGSQRHNLAAVVEFIHTATLLHDDVVDESKLRRGRPTNAWTADRVRSSSSMRMADEGLMCGVTRSGQVLPL